MKKIISMLLFFLFSLAAYSQEEVEVLEVNGDTILAVPMKYLPTINGVFEENKVLKEEIKLKDSLIEVDSVLLRNKDLQLDSWVRREALWNEELKRERAKRRKLLIGTGVGATVIGILIGLLVK